MFLSYRLRSFKSGRLYNNKNNPYIKVNGYIDIVNDNNLSPDNKFLLLRQYNSIHDKKNLKDITNFNKLYDYCLSQGTNHNPSQNIKNGLTQVQQVNNLETQIKSMPSPIKETLLNYYTKKDDKRLEWIKYVLKLPRENKVITIPNNNTKDFLDNIRKLIDNDIYGMDNVKDDLISMIYTYITSNQTHKTIALMGPPGTGKTELVRLFAKYIDLPFTQISVGSVNDASYLIGHAFTYQSSQPGYIIKSIVDMKYKNGIIFLDEIDKIASSHRGDEILSVLLHLCDFTQNSTFNDNYLENIPIDMSNYLFIYSMNNIDNISKALLSRISQNLVEVEDYTINDKIQIVKNFILPKCFKEYNTSDINFPDDVIKYIINTYCFSAKGVRELQGVIRKIIRIINYKNIIGNELYKLPIDVSIELVDNIMNRKNKDTLEKYIM